MIVNISSPEEEMKKYSAKSAYVQKFIEYHLVAKSSHQEWALYSEAHIDAQFVNLIANDNTRVLYVGCGTGGYFHFFKKAKLIYGVDTNYEMVEVAKEPPNIELMSPYTQIITDTEIPKDQKFDVVFYHPFSSYEAITNERLSQLASLLDAEGKLVLHFPNRFPKNSVYREIIEFCKIGVKTLVNLVLGDRYHLIFDIRVFGAINNLSKRILRVANLHFAYMVKNNNLLCLIYTKKHLDN